MRCRNKLLIIFILLITATDLLFSQIVVFRCDDYGLDEPYFYLNLKKAIEDSGAKITLGVVPLQMSGLSSGAVQDSILIALAKSPSIEIAQHGLTHSSWSYGTEFMGRSFPMQKGDITKGKMIIEQKTGKQIKTFIPPFNTYDGNTVRALQDLHFRSISGGVSNSASAPDNSIINFIPSTISLYRFSKLALQGKLKKDVIYIVLFHTYDFIENQEFYAQHGDNPYNIANSHEFMSIDLPRFGVLLGLLRDKKVQFMTISELADRYGPKVFSANIISNNKSNSYFPLPELLYSQHPGYLLTTNSWVSKNKNTLIGIFFYLTLLSLSYAFTTALDRNRHIKKYMVIIFITFSVIVFAFTFISMRDGSLGYKILLMLSMYAGMTLRMLRRRLSEV